MSIFGWLSARFSNRGKALVLYKRGMARASARDYEGAINEYNSALEQSESNELTAMLLYNRSLAYFAAGNHEKGIDDLRTVLEMDDAPSNVKSKAKEKLVRKEK